METENSDVDKLKLEISKLQSSVKVNPYNYDSHVELVSLLSKLYSVYDKLEKNNELDAEQKKLTNEQTKVSFTKLRFARQSMSSVYPLTNELWINWIKDEVEASPDLINHEVITDIFSKAAVDYICVDIWCMHVAYLIKRLNEDKCTVDEIRDTLENGVLNCGLHYRDGNKIWRCYQEFEQTCLLQAEKEVKENNSQINIEKYRLQLLKLVNLFKRELSLPLAEHDVSHTRYCDVVEPHIKTLKSLLKEQELGFNTEQINKIHTNTINNMQEIEDKESNLDKHQHSLEAYESYIMHELASLCDPARIQCLFERAIIYHCLTPSLWLDYIDFLNNVIKLPDLIISVCRRALRNITWDCRIYIKYTTFLEQESHNSKDIRQAYEEGLEKYSNNGFNYCSLLIFYLSFEKRLCKDESAIMKIRPRIYKIIQQALHQFQQIEDVDKSIIEFVLFWVDIERFWFKDVEKEKDIWKYMLSKYKCLWGHAVTYARTTGKPDLINDIFQIALLQYPDEIDTFSQSLYNYETMYGKLDSLNYLMKKVNLSKPLGIRIKKPKENQHILSKIQHENKFIKSWLRTAEDKLFWIDDNVETIVKKDKRKHVTANKPKGVDKMYVDIDEDEQKNHGQKRKHDVEMETNSNSSHAEIGPVLPPGFISKKNESESDSDSDSDSEDDDDDDEQTQNNMPPIKKLKVDDDKCESNSEPLSYSSTTTVFVSNLHPATKTSELEMIFSRAGEIEKVDLRKQRGGKIFAFVTYKTAEGAQKAYNLEHTPLYNRPLYVSAYKNTDKNDPTAAPPALQYSQTEEKNKLYVSNLSKLTTQNDLEKLFNQYGDMSSLRLINKKGSSRPFAFVEYATTEAANRYRKAVNGTEVRGLPIVVEFSNPGVRQQKTVKSNFETQRSYNKQNVDEGEAMETDTHVDKEADDKVFVKPKPLSVGLVPFQARAHRNVQPVNKSQTTKVGPAVRINFVPAGGDKTTNNSEPGSDASDEPVAEKKDQSSTDAVSSARKSNDEFRRMFFKQ